MVEGLAAELLCSVCDEVCKRGAQMKCCGVRACRACAVLKINKTKKCWNEECGQEDITASTDLKNDALLKKAVEFFNKYGMMNPQHEKLLKKTKDGKTLEKKKIGKVDKEKKEPLDVAEVFNQPYTSTGIYKREIKCSHGRIIREDWFRGGGTVLLASRIGGPPQARHQKK